MFLIKQPISPEDEACYFQVVREYDDLMRKLDVSQVPMCHVKAMTIGTSANVDATPKTAPRHGQK